MVDGWLKHLHDVARPALLVAPRTFLADIRAACAANEVRDAVARRDSKPIFNRLIQTFQYQGISDAAADGFSRKHGSVSWDRIGEGLQQTEGCPLLRNHWSFSGCGYRKSAQTCSHPANMPACLIPRLPLRKGILNQSAVSMFLFIRDAAEGDLVGWIDNQLEAADHEIGVIERAAAMRTAVIEPLKNVIGISDKILGMALADLLLGGDPNRERWVTAGASMIAVDSLVHNFMHRTGVLRRAGSEHPYGPRCYAKNGCADIIAAFAQTIDAREFNADFPAYFPRFLQLALWKFCSQGFLDVCNANRIENGRRCHIVHCPNFSVCDRIPLRTR